MSTKEIAINHMPVSDTHLDVYKRQGGGRGFDPRLALVLFRCRSGHLFLLLYGIYMIKLNEYTKLTVIVNGGTTLKYRTI